MTDQNHPAGTGDHDSTGWVILGGALIAAGLFLGARTLGILPWPFVEFWGLAVKARYGIGVVVVGILLIVWAQSGRRFVAPVRGTKLYRVREGKWVAGVLGGLAEYFQVDVTWLRLAFIALAVLLDMGGALLTAYIIMAIVVPQEPEAPQGAVTAAPAPAAVPAPPAPVEPAPPAADNAAPPAPQQFAAPAPPVESPAAEDAGPDHPAGVTQA